MSERLRQFVRDMSENLDRAKQLTIDPEGELSRSDLSPEEQQIILSRDPDKIREATGMAASESVTMNSFFEPVPAKPTKPAKPRKPSKRKPARKPAKKAPPKKRSAKRAVKSSRKTSRKAARKPSRRRR
jgi:hypothetical protein